MPATRRRAGTSAPGDGSRTIIVTDSQPQEDNSQGPNNDDIDEDTSNIGALRLRGGPRNSRPRVAWGEDVVDNEGCGRKKSKICCIYHKPRRFDESSDESDSDSEGDSDSSVGGASHNHGARPAHSHRHRRLHSNGGGASMRDGGGSSGATVHEPNRDGEPNAYEIMPGPRKGKEKAV